MYSLKKSANDGAVNDAGSTCCVGFVGVDVHSGSIAGGNADNNAVKDQGTSGVELNLNYFLIGYAEISSGFGGEVDVSLCSDYAFGKGNGAAGTNESASTGALDVTGFANGSLYADGSCIGEGDFNLGFFSCRAENGHFEFALFAFNGYFFFASKLTGLAESLFNGELVSCAEKCFDVFFRKMDVSCGCFNENFVFHWSISHFLDGNRRILLYSYVPFPTGKAPRGGRRSAETESYLYLL